MHDTQFSHSRLNLGMTLTPTDQPGTASTLHRSLDTRTDLSPLEFCHTHAVAQHWHTLTRRIALRRQYWVRWRLRIQRRMILQDATYLLSQQRLQDALRNQAVLDVLSAWHVGITPRRRKCALPQSQGKIAQTEEEKKLAEEQSRAREIAEQFEGPKWCRRRRRWCASPCSSERCSRVPSFAASTANSRP